jgi:hypothetical protein
MLYKNNRGGSKISPALFGKPVSERTAQERQEPKELTV